MSSLEIYDPEPVELNPKFGVGKTGILAYDNITDANDHIHRVISDRRNVIVAHGSMPTSTFVKCVHELLNRKNDVVDTLRGIVHWQKRRLDYQAIYSAYLLGAIGEKEFEEDSEEFSNEIRNISFDDLVSAISKIRRATDLDFATADFADYFSAEASSIIPAIEAVDSMKIELEVTDSDAVVLGEDQKRLF